MPRVSANGLDLEYDTTGDPSGPPLLLIMGLGAQMISWDEDLCRLLADRGFHVIRFDNRDVGLSTKLDHLGVPDLREVLTGRTPPAYTLEDMADDAVGLLDALGIERAHIVGASMGGFIVQSMAIRHPSRVLSMTSIMSGPGGLADNAPATPEATEALLKPPPTEREAMIEHGVWVASRISGPEFFDPEDAREKRIRAIDRSVSMDGTARQMAAIAASRSRAEALGRLTIPVLVVHGAVDPLVPIENGRRTADAIPGARLLVLPGAGHDLPRPYWPEVVDGIAATAHAADSGVAAPV